MTDEEKKIFDAIFKDGVILDMIANINNKIKILSDRLEDIRLEYPNIGMKDGEEAVRIFKELEMLHSQISSLTLENPST